jgi:protein transport protein SEC61 subunit gamma-like protein
MIKDIGNWLRKFFFQSKRVLYLAKKPNKDEFIVISKITGLGIALVGFLGFAVFVFFNLIRQGGVL